MIIIIKPIKYPSPIKVAMIRPLNLYGDFKCLSPPKLITCSEQGRAIPIEREKERKKEKDRNDDPTRYLGPNVKNLESGSKHPEMRNMRQAMR